MRVTAGKMIGAWPKTMAKTKPRLMACSAASRHPWPGAKAPAKEAQDKPAERVFDLYRHGVEIRLEGSYDDLQVYMAQLEKLPQRLLWGELVYRVIDYPRAEIRLTLYSLSPDKAWLAL